MPQKRPLVPQKHPKSLVVAALCWSRAESTEHEICSAHPSARTQPREGARQRMTNPQQSAAPDASLVAAASGIRERILARFLELLKNDDSAGDSVAAVFVNVAATGKLSDRTAIQAAVLQAVGPSHDQTTDA
jgi:hypothetical protein